VIRRGNYVNEAIQTESGWGYRMAHDRHVAAASDLPIGLLLHDFHQNGGALLRRGENDRRINGLLLLLGEGLSIPPFTRGNQKNLLRGGRPHRRTASRRVSVRLFVRMRVREPVYSPSCPAPVRRNSKPVVGRAGWCRRAAVDGHAISLVVACEAAG
jgi:hypothetical protein